MANKLQLFIYRLSALSPLGLVFAVVWYYQKGTLIVPVVCAGIGLVTAGVFAVSFLFGKRHIAPVRINVIEASPKDNWLIGYVISYLIPFMNIALKDFDIRISLMIALAIVVFIPFVNSASPHPLLFVFGYPFYELGTKNGIKEYVNTPPKTVRDDPACMVHSFSDLLREFSIFKMQIHEGGQIMTNYKEILRPKCFYEFCKRCG